MSNRKIASALGIDKCTVNKYVRKAMTCTLSLEALLLLEGSELEAQMFAGNPADVITQLGTGEYIKMGGTIIISGAAGTGKTYHANALGYKTCRQGYKVSYFTMQSLSD